MVEVELVYVAPSNDVHRVSLTLEDGACVQDVLTQSGFLERYPEIKDLPLGIFSKRVALDVLVKDGDRIEVYRPLLIDPKDKRRVLAKKRG
ncbi:MAG: RnfH family protein [Chlamydiae bacterium]|nr:RnfH family protein [Chlamydiota bacterium]